MQAVVGEVLEFGRESEHVLPIIAPRISDKNQNIKKIYEGKQSFVVLPFRYLPVPSEAGVKLGRVSEQLSEFLKSD